MTQLNRRDILKLSAAVLGGVALSSIRPLSQLARGLTGAGQPNFIVLVLDSMSARNLSLFGYARSTTPGFERLAERSTVYHNHYAGGNFTAPGTATLLTGRHPWTHRCVNLGGQVARAVETENIFHYLGEKYQRVAFSHNHMAYLLLGQFSRDIDTLLSRTAFALQKNVPMVEDRFVNDLPVAYYSFEDFLGASHVNPASMTLGLINLLSYKKSEIKSAPNFPRGYPYNYSTYFRIEDILSGLAEMLPNLAGASSPFFAYFHLLPPHSPYNPRKQYIQPFLSDGLTFPAKPNHPLTSNPKPADRLERLRIAYDSFVANVDFEVERFVRGLEQAGILDSTYLIITSDHGEMFERGFDGHGSKLMYEPVVHIPLIVHAPGQTSRQDIYAPTSNVDLAPTILSLAGRDIPGGIEGQLLPGLGGTEDPDRSAFAVYAKENSSFLPLDTAVMSVRKGEHHLIYYRGYEGYDERAELYHLAEDAEELQDIAAKDVSTTRRLTEELLDLVNTADAPYRRAG